MFSNSSTKVLLPWYAYLVMTSTLTKLTFESKTSVMQITQTQMIYCYKVS